MGIQTYEEMEEFCKHVGDRFEVGISDYVSDRTVSYFEKANGEMIQNGKLSKGSNLQQGILSIDYKYGIVSIVETPYLYPSPKILAENPNLTGPMTGNLSNCYDPSRKLFLFHMRGKDISAPFRFQAAAAGMSYFREHPRETARKELIEEAGINYPAILFYGKAIDVLPFMKSEKIPQPLFSFGFEYDLNGFHVCHDLDEIDEFEEKTKGDLAEGKIEQKEGYHFTIHLDNLEEIVGGLEDRKKFYGPIYRSTINFLKSLKDIHNI